MQPRNDQHEYVTSEHNTDTRYKHTLPPSHCHTFALKQHCTPTTALDSERAHHTLAMTFAQPNQEGQHHGWFEASYWIA